MEAASETQRKNGRFIFAVVCIACGFVVLASRLVILQVVEFSDFSREAQKQHQTIRSVEPGRGTIYDRRENVWRLIAMCHRFLAIPCNVLIPVRLREASRPYWVSMLIVLKRNYVRKNRLSGLSEALMITQRSS